MNLRTLIVASVLATGSVSGAVAQSAGIYVLHSWATSTCPAMDWHVTLDPTATGNNVSGIIGWGEGMQHIARVAGRINPNTRFFEMTATEVGGESRTAKIDGQLRLDGWLTADVTGDAFTCKSITVPYYVPPLGGAG